MSEKAIVVVAGVLMVLVVVPWLLGKHGRALAVRWFAGQPLTGRPYRTDATWYRRGTKLLHHAPARPFWYRPTWQRVAIRQGISLVALVVIWARFTHPLALARILALVVLAAVVTGAWVGYRKAVNWHVNRVYVQPLHVALSHALDLPATTTAADYITMPASWKKNPDTPVKVLLPKRFDASADNKARIGGLLLQKLDKSDREFTVDWNTLGQPYMVAKKDPKPPEFVPLTPEILAAVDACGPSEIVIGYDASDKLQIHDLATESPHAAFSCESGAGKSAFLEWVAAQVLRKDPNNEVRQIDPKFASTPGLVGVPNVITACNPILEGIEEMWELTASTAQEVMRRGQALKDNPTSEFPLLLFIIDEVNVLASFSATHWNTRLKQKGKPPIWADLLTILAAGRKFRVHAIIVGQDMRESALGGIGLRAMLGLRGIGGQYDAQMWARFIQTRPVERPSTIKGRWSYRIGGRQKWIQNVYATPEEINAMARVATFERAASSTPAPEPGAPVTVTVAGTRPDDARSDQGRQTVTEHSVTGSVTASGRPDATPEAEVEAPVTAELYTLAEAARKGIVPMNPAQLRQAKSRDGDAFPKGTMVGKREKWTADQLNDWIGDRLARAVTNPKNDDDDNS